MKKKLAVLLASLMLAVWFGGQGVSSATNICVSYTATGPLIGTRSGMRCVPSPYTHTFTFWNCKSIPPAGIYTCFTLTADLP